MAIECDQETVKLRDSGTTVSLLYEYKIISVYPGYNNNNNRMNGNYGRTNRRALDRELDGYMQKSARYNRARLDEDMDKYMSGTKAYLDKQMDEYMSAKKKVQ